MVPQANALGLTVLILEDGAIYIDLAPFMHIYFTYNALFLRWMHGQQQQQL